jgi:DNA-binding transcriptional LysR family regulator
MDFQQLRVFRSAARSGGFTKAGELLNLSQSTVSQHIRQLEEEVGGRLFLRTGRRVVLSEAGSLLLLYADRILQDVKHAGMAVRELSARQRGRVRLGTGASTLIYRLPVILSEYSQRFPGTELVIVTGTTEFLLEAIRSEQLDLAIVMSPTPEAGLQMAHLSEEELVIALGRQHPLANKRVLTPEAMGKLGFIMYAKHTAMQSLMDAYFESMAVTPQIAMEIENIEAIKSLVGAGLGAAILPRCTVAESGQGSAIKVMTVRQKLFRKLGLVRREGTMPPPAIEELWKALMAGLGPPGESHR